MQISSLLRAKGDFVATIDPGATVAAALSELARHDVGALVVSTDGRHPEGIISERDVVRRLHAEGTEVLARAVAEVMTTPVHTCRPDAAVEQLMAVMTTRRTRHVPVVADDVLVGIVSIGDVVKRRLVELEDERQALVDYISGR